MQSPVLHIYCDESRQTSNRYMVLGGLIIRASLMPVFNEAMSSYRHKFNMTAELKWSKVSKTKLPEYKGFVEYFFALNSTERAHFHCIIIDNHKVDYRKYHGNDKELGMYKFFYQLILHTFGRHYTTGDPRIVVHFDKSQSRYPLADFRDILNNGIAKSYNRPRDTFVSIESRDSKDCEALQINDILLGAVGFHKNGCHLIPGCSQPKCELAKYIADQSGLAHLGNDTQHGARRFRVWNWEPRQAK